MAIISLPFLYSNFEPSETSYKGGEKEPTKDEPQIKPFDPSRLSWVLATSSAEWSPRDSGASFVFQNKMWMMGGVSGNENISSERIVKYWESPHFNDIWSSEDGVTWKLEKEHAEWPDRRSMSVVYFQDKLWMFGGWSPISGYASDVWQSTDAINWTEVAVSSSFPIREGQTADVFGGKIWITGGVNYNERVTKNDVWWSDNGIDWHEATASAPWSGRWDHATAVFNDKIFLSGGMDLSGHMFKDVWSTSDGINWELVIAEAPWKERQGHSMVVLHDKMWLVGILSDTEGGGVNDVWYTSEGSNWEKTLANPQWLGREDHSVLVYKDKMFVFQGMNSSWKWTNDVWYSIN
ncbi:MAG: sialidase family protein [Patescibacteria group bacterium]